MISCCFNHCTSYLYLSLMTLLLFFVDLEGNHYFLKKDHPLFPLNNPMTVELNDLFWVLTMYLLKVWCFTLLIKF